MRESEVESYLHNLVLSIGGLSIKIAPNGKRGWPDRLVILPPGRVWFVELKRPGEVPRGQQLLRHAELLSLGLQVVTLDSKRTVEEFVDEIS